MALSPTGQSRVSVGWVSSTVSIVGQDAGDTGDVFSVTGNAKFFDGIVVDGTATITGALTQTGAVAIGGGTGIVKVASSIISVGGAAVTGNESTVSEYALTGAVAGDQVLLTPDASKWSGAYHDINFSAGVTTADQVNIALVNSAETDITPDAMNWRATLIRF